MAIWIEFRCEGRVINESCWSNFNAGPMDLSCDDQKSVLDTLRLLKKCGETTGWKRLREGWVCPHCLEIANGKAPTKDHEAGGSR